MRRFEPSLMHRQTRLAAPGALAAALLLSAAGACAAGSPAGTASAASWADECISACARQAPEQQKQAQPSPQQQPRASDGTKLWMEIYTGNSYSN